MHDLFLLQELIIQIFQVLYVHTVDFSNVLYMERCYGSFFGGEGRIKAK